MTMDAVARAEIFRKRRQVTFEVGDGDDPLLITVNIPSVMDLIEAGLDPIVANVNVTEEARRQALQKQQEEFEADVRKFFPIAKKLCQKVMVSPKLHLDETTDPPPGYVTPEILGNLLLQLATEVMGLLQSEVGEAGEAMANFRLATDRQNGAEGGDVVRDEPAGDSPTTGS